MSKNARITKVSDFFKVLRRSQLLSDQQLNLLEKRVEPIVERRQLNAENLAQMLVKQDILTHWQSQMLLRRVTKGFFLGKYKMMSMIGKGDHHRLFLAEHQKMRRQVTIKVLLNTTTDPIALKRFVREGEVIAALDHPNVVRAFDFDREGEVHFLVLEYVEGEDLQSIVDREGPREVEEAADWIRQAAEGLEYVHDISIIHRDIMPKNLICDHEGVVKLADLGVARIFSEDKVSLTMKHGADDLIGTIEYISPEQAMDSATIDARSDIYSLGCTFFFLLAGHPPFNEGSPTQRLMARQMESPPQVRQYRSDVPEEVEDLICQMMAKDRDQRIQTAGEVADILDELYPEQLD